MKLIFLLSCWLLIQPTIAQNFKQDFLEVYNHHQNRACYEQELRVQSFAKKGDRKPMDEQKGRILKGKDTYYSKLVGQETIINGKHFLFINHEEKRMTYYDEVSINIAELAQGYKQGLDSVDKSQIVFLGEEGNYKRYQINSPKEMIKTTEVVLDMEKKMLTRIIYYYQPVNAYKSTLYKTILDYKLISTAPPSSSWFEWKKYVTIKGGKAILNPKYKEFRLTQKEEKKNSKNKTAN